LQILKNKKNVERITGLECMTLSDPAARLACSITLVYNWILRIV